MLIIRLSFSVDEVMSNTPLILIRFFVTFVKGTCFYYFHSSTSITVVHYGVEFDLWQLDI